LPQITQITQNRVAAVCPARRWRQRGSACSACSAV